MMAVMLLVKLSKIPGEDVHPKVYLRMVELHGHPEIYLELECLLKADY